MKNVKKLVEITVIEKKFLNTFLVTNMNNIYIYLLNLP